MFRERRVVQRELELINDSLDRYRIEVLEGHARFLDPNTVAVFNAAGALQQVVTAGVIVIATGSSPHRPQDIPFDGQLIFDSETILQLPRMPRSMMVLGAGVIGIEYASIFAALGLEVTLVDTRERLLPFCDGEITAILERELDRLGVTTLHQDKYKEVERLEGRRVRCLTDKGRALEADVMLYATGRDGNTRDLGLDRLGIAPNAYGNVEVNASYQTRHPHIYAVGDVIGYPALASTSMEQGRQAIRHAFNIQGVATRTDLLPYAVYAIPEVSYLGDTEEALRKKGVDYVVGRARYDLNARGQIIGDTEGLLKLVFEAGSLKLLGIHIVGTAASELIHIGEAFLRAGADAQQVAETLYNYPTLSDMYRHAAVKAIGDAARMRRR
jgi:NAD(P) transhydrogenase